MIKEQVGNAYCYFCVKKYIDIIQLNIARKN